VKEKTTHIMAFRYALPASILIALSLNPSNAGDAQDFRLAQIYNRPPADIDAVDAGGGEVAHLTLRIDRLEREIRLLTGRIEELQHTIQRLEETRKLQPDSAPQASVSAPPGSPSGAAMSSNAAAGQLKRGDAFDPAREPAAVGAPRPLGSTPPSAPLTTPLATQAARNAVDQGLPDAVPPMPRDPGAPLDLPPGGPGVDPAPPSAPADASAALPAPPGPKDEYEVALSYLHKGQYETAEKGFSAFLSKNPKSRLAPAATFNLGESYFLRGRHREAAEKYLEVSSKYASSAQAPDALLRLGQALIVLGAKEQACASFSEIGAKYPNAPPRTKEAAQRERKKIPC
jgi:tol-pal system protein YbgF